MFQSTHPRGVRHNLGFTTYLYRSFNPRTHEGCDFSSCFCCRCLFVSIHAPTRGATFEIEKSFPNRGFNPRTHEGCDKEIQNSNDWSFVSIHAPTRGATFNQAQMFKALAVSIHAPTRGATSTYHRKDGIALVSIHAPTRGATAYSAKYRILIYKSSHFANINQTITFKVIKSLEFL